MSLRFRFVFAVACLLLLSVAASSQGIFATLTGVVTDPSQSVVPNAKVTLKDVESGSVRETITNGMGYYTFASAPVGTYSVTVEASGFKTHKDDQVRLGGGEHRDLNVTLVLGSTEQTVEVSATQDFTVTPVDSGEKSFTLATKELENFTQVGSNAAEYIKIMPGFGNNAMTASNKANYSGETIGINANGDGGSQSPLNDAYSYNGLPPNTLDIVSDGAHVSDPGCNCDTPVNPNSDFLQEFKIFTSNFSAEDQKGPAVITSVTKAGGNQFHGSGFLYARNYVLNANDALFNAEQQPKPANKYYYPGGSIGGPVLIPGTDFNRNRDKLFFFTGFEYFYQTLDTGLLRAVVPTQQELQGNFSPSVVAGEGPGGSQLNSLGQSAFPNDQIPTTGPPGKSIDPSMQNLMKLYPAANFTPTVNDPYNYVKSEVFNQNNRQWTTRVDYNVSTNTKIYARYNYQREVQLFPVQLWWRQNDQVPYPSSIEGKNRSDALTGTITHVFSTTMTNETVMSYTFIGFPNVFSDPKKVDRSLVGYSDPVLFPNRNIPVPQIPSFGNNGGGGEAALIFNPGGFEAGGNAAGLYANKYMPNVSDTLTKVWRTHTFKAGFFYEWIRNTQPANNFTNGYMQYVPSNNVFSYGNAYADMLTGNMSQYNETNFNRLNDISYNTVEGFVQDSWKLHRRLTLELGLRFTHFSPWVDDENYGYSVFDQSSFDPSCASAFCGFQWHAKDSAIPLGGFSTRTLFYQPRFGLAYDVFGTGQTVLRGGWGRFYFHSGQFTAGLDASAGVASLALNPNTNPVPGQLIASQLNSINVPAAPAAPSAVDAKDDRQPYTDSYSFTIAQRTPWHGLLEVSYVGNQSNDLLNTGGAGSNINLVPAGAMFAAPGGAGNADPNAYRPLQGYGDLNVATNNLYANYNSLQVAWARHAGRYTMQVNYTFEKSLGIVSPGTPAAGSNVALDQLNLRSNYGVQAGNRTHLFNTAYSIALGNPMHGNRFLDGAVNGWQLSGVLQVQSGQNLTYTSNGADFNFQLAGPGGSGAATDASGDKLNNQFFLGTNAVQLNPVVTCNPGSGLKSHQFANPSCFAVPSGVGQNGPTLLPVVYGPAFFNADLGLFKNFKITESKTLQFRVQGYNFLNHPLWSFPSNENLTLKFDQTAPGSSSFVLDPTSANFGTAVHKEGHRIIETAIKFYF